MRFWNTQFAIRVSQFSICLPNFVLLLLCFLTFHSIFLLDFWCLLQQQFSTIFLNTSILFDVLVRTGSSIGSSLVLLEHLSMAEAPLLTLLRVRLGHRLVYKIGLLLFATIERRNSCHQVALISHQSNTKLLKKRRLPIYNTPLFWEGFDFQTCIAAVHKPQSTKPGLLGFLLPKVKPSAWSLDWLVDISDSQHSIYVSLLRFTKVHKIMFKNSRKQQKEVKTYWLNFLPRPTLVILSLASWKLCWSFFGAILFWVELLCMNDPIFECVSPLLEVSEKVEKASIEPARELWLNLLQWLRGAMVPNENISLSWVRRNNGSYRGQL